MRNVDQSMALICERLKSTAQRALDDINFVISYIENIAEGCEGREDILACLSDIKSKIKASENQNWVTALHWCDHFDDIADEGDENKSESEGEALTSPDDEEDEE